MTLDDLIQLAYKCSICGRVLKGEDALGDYEVYKLNYKRVCTICAAKLMVHDFPNYKHDEPASKTKIVNYLANLIDAEAKDLHDDYSRSAGRAEAYRRVLTALRNGIFN